MFTHISPFGVFAISIGTVCLYLLILGSVFGRKLVSGLGRSFREPAAPLSTLQVASAGNPALIDTLPPLIDKPADHPTEQTRTYESYDDPYAELVDETSLTLLRSAENVVEQIQDTIDHVASRPVNREEVLSKIHAIVSQYGFFEETEYYDAINSFVAVTVERDCELTLTEDELKSLWLSEAA